MLKGKTAIVTGSTSGIGLGIAHALAAEGCNIMFNGFGDKTEIEQIVASTAKDFSVKTAYNGADMSKGEQIRSMVHETAETFGSVDILVNNAGIQHTASITDFPEEKWDAILSINLSAVFHGTKAVLPFMQKQSYGRIINIASVHGLVASKNKSAYVAAKHGVIGLTKVTALENAENHITCNAICPGWTLTPLVQKQIDDKAAKEGSSAKEAQNALLGEKQPNMKFVTVEQLGQLAIFFCSDNASAITGSAYTMDGGWTAQ